MKKAAYVLGVIATMGVGSLIVASRTAVEPPPSLQEPPQSNDEWIRLSASARAIHENVAQQVAARTESLRQGPDPIPVNRSALPQWLQGVIDQGYVDARYADLFLRDDYLAVVQEQFHVVKQAPLAAEELACDRHDVEHGRAICWNRWGYEPYLSYDLPALQSMADSDPVAAAALALRLEDPEASLYYAIRATRLADKPGPLVRYLTMHANASGQHAGASLLRRYALALMVDDMGYPYRYSVGLAQELERAEIPQEEIDRALVAGFTVEMPGRIGQ